MWMRKVEAETAQWGPADEPALVCSEAAFAQAFHYWRGASGRRYLHSVYTLIGCPALPRANYILVRRYEDGRRLALAFGQAEQLETRGVAVDHVERLPQQVIDHASPA